MLVMGAMIGSGIFITSAESARLVGAPGWLLLAWALAGLMTVSGAIASAELAAMMPRAGGQYVFLRVAYGPMFGFLFGWSLFLVVQTGTIAAVSVAFAKFLGVFLPFVSADVYLVPPLILGHYALSLSTQQAVALILIVALTITNTQGLKLGTLIQNTFTVAKTAALVGLIVDRTDLGREREGGRVDLVVVERAGERVDVDRGIRRTAAGGGAARPHLPARAGDDRAFVLAIGLEQRDLHRRRDPRPRPDLAPALFLGTTSVVALYLLANLAYLVSLPFTEIQHAPQDRVGTAAMEAALGPSARYVMAAAILVSTFGCVNGLVLAGARVYYAMARDGLFFKSVGTTNSHHVPAVALAAQGLWAAILTLPVTVTTEAATGKVAFGNLYNDLLEYIIPVDVTFYMLMVGAVIALRIKAPMLNRPYRTVGYPVPALIYIGLAVFLVLDFIYLKTKTSGIGFLILLAGIPVYLIWQQLSVPRRSRRNRPPSPPLSSDDRKLELAHRLHPA